MVRSIAVVAVTVVCACGAEDFEQRSPTLGRKPTPHLIHPRPNEVRAMNLDAPRPGATDLFYRSFGDAQGRTMIFLHDSGANAYPFELVAPAIAARGIRVITYDQRGCGRSPTGGDPDYSVEKSVEDLDALIHALGLTEPILVGHGAGGTLALQYAHAHPGTARGIVLVSTPVDLPKTYFDAQLSCIDRDQAMSASQAVEDLHVLHDRMFPNGLTAPFAFAAKDVLLTVQSAHDCGLMNAGQQTTPGLVFWQSAEASPLFSDRRWNVLEAYEHNDHLGGLSFFDQLTVPAAPIAAIYGDSDPFVTSEQATQVSTALGVGHLKWISGAGQYPFFDDPNGFSDALAVELKAFP